MILYKRIFLFFIFLSLSIIAQSLNTNKINNFSNLADITITDVTNTNLIGDPSNGGSYGGHGAMFADVDNDGDPDLYITMNYNIPMADLYFENNGNGIFTEKATLHGIDDFDDGSHGWVWADLDNDGDFDGWNGSYFKNIPYENKNHEPSFFNNRFENSGIIDVKYRTRGVTAFDYDGDGDLDLFANNWYNDQGSEPNEFYRNDGNFSFTEIDNGLLNAKGEQGVCDGDFDNDGDVDLMICVYQQPERCVEIWENNNGQFSPVQNTGLDLCNTIDGATFWDMNNDGWLDIVSGEKIYINNKNRTFTELINVPAGIRFMRGITDINNDGYWDIVSPGASTFYINNGDLTFSPKTFSSGDINDPRSVAFADVDNDGDVDFVYAQKKTFNRLYRNDYSGNNKYLFIKLIGEDNQIGSFGTKVSIYSSFGDTLLSYREAHGNQGYLSQDDPTLHFGVGTRENVKIKVSFLNGSEFSFISTTNRRLLLKPEKFEINSPLSLVASADTVGQIKLNWDDIASNEIGYVVYRRTGEAVDFNPIDSIAANSNTYVDFDVHEDILYNYVVLAYNDFAMSQESNIVTVRSLSSTINVPSKLVTILSQEFGVPVLSWIDNSDNELGFIIERRKIGESFEVIDTVTESQTSYTDFLVQEFTNYEYRIVGYATNIKSEYSNISQINVLTAIRHYSTSLNKYHISQNYPNPFNPNTKINFNVPEHAYVVIKLFNTLGEELFTLIQGDYSPGKYEVWLDGSKLSSGIYLYSMIGKGVNGNNFSTIRKLTLLK